MAVAAAVATRAAAKRRHRRSDVNPPVPPPLPPGRIVDLPGRGEVFARDSGGPAGAPVVLLLHGWTATADVNFFSAYDELVGEFRVVALDHRGHGRGMRSVEPFSLEDCADDAAALLEQLGVERAVVVGYSMGGPIALLMARRHPHLVAGLVAQATALEWSGEWWERTRWRGLALMELGLRFGTGESVLARMLDRMTRRVPEVGPLRPWLIGEFRRGHAADIAGAGRALAAFDARPWAGSLPGPAAVVVTTRDRLVPPTKQRALAQALRADVLELRADHESPLTHPREYSAVTCQAVLGVSRRSGVPAR